MRIHKGDNVILLSGKDKGKTGKIVRSMPKKDLVVVEGLNIRKKTQRPKSQGAKGQIIEKPMPIHVSNVSLIDPKSKKQTRIRFKTAGDKKVRISAKSGEKI